MQDTILIRVTNKKAIMHLHNMEALDLIKVVKENVFATKTKLSDKIKEFFLKEDAASIN